MTQLGRAPACANMNHRRANSPVPYCPQCGGVVNAAIARRNCGEDQHALSRRQGSIYCVGCGTQLIVGRR